VHQVDELGLAGDEGHEVANQQRGALALVGHRGILQDGLQPPLQLGEGQIDGRLPQLLLAAEVVLQEAEIDAGPGGNVAGGGAVVSLLREGIEGRDEDTLARVATRFD
jgi:hypothetical protein